MLLYKMFLKNNSGLTLGNIRLKKAMKLIKNINLCVVVTALDYYTKWPEAAPLIIKTAVSIAKFL